MKVILVIFYVLTAAGLWSLVTGYRSFGYRHALRHEGVHATGMIVEYKAHGGGDQNTWYVPVIEFTAADGKAYRFESDRDPVNYESQFEKGNPVDIVYIPSDPSVAVLAGAESTYGGGVTTILIGVFLLLVAAMVRYGAARIPSG